MNKRHTLIAVSGLSLLFAGLAGCSTNHAAANSQGATRVYSVSNSNGYFAGDAMGVVVIAGGDLFGEVQVAGVVTEDGRFLLNNDSSNALMPDSAFVSVPTD